jgi:hypothetical protein
MEWGRGTRPTDWKSENRPVSWGEFVQQVIDTNTSGWVFRGQPDYEYELITFLERSLANVPRVAWGDREDSAIDFFRSRASATLDQVPEQDDYLGWLSLMQHYQAPTRLLDWSESPFVAAYFALAEVRSQDPPESVAVWALNARAIRWYFEEPDVRRQIEKYLWPDDPRPLPYRPEETLDQLVAKANEVVRPDGVPAPLAREAAMHALENACLRYCRQEQIALPFPTRPARPDQRMLAQRAVFTYDGAMNGGISLGLANSSGLGEGDIVKKIELPLAWHEEAMETLFAMGISADALFPGIVGIGRSTAMHVRVGRPTIRDVLRHRGQD